MSKHSTIYTEENDMNEQDVKVNCRLAGFDLSWEHLALLSPFRKGECLIRMMFKSNREIEKSFPF